LQQICTLFRNQSATVTDRRYMPVKGFDARF
jgi:hypothetical protein